MLKLIQKILLTVLLYFFCNSLALAQNHPNSLAVSQGISSPNRTTSTLYSKGFTRDNPMAVSYQTGYRLTGSLDGGDGTGLGIEGGLGDGQYGLAIGHYSNDCEGCDGNLRGSISAIWGRLGVGLGVIEDHYSLGFLLNPNGIHRLGLVAEFENNQNQRSGFGLGYSFMLPRFTFALDLSKQTFENDIGYEDPLLVTPGLAVRIDVISVSLSYDIYIDDPLDIYRNQVWFGIGVNPTKNWELAFYSEYINSWNLQASYFF